MKWLRASLANKFLAWLINLRVLASFLAGITMAIHFGEGLPTYSSALENMLQAFEPYIYITSNAKEFCVLMLGGLLLLSDAPFLTPLSREEMLRIGRRRWVIGQIWYVFLASLAYFLAILVFLAIFAGVTCGVYLLGGWSDTMEVLAFIAPSAAATNYGVAFSFPELLRSADPVHIMAESLALHTLYLTFISLIILCVNLYTRRNLGWIFGSVTHFLGYMISQNIGFSMPGWMSLLCYVIPAYHYGSAVDVPGTVCILMLLILAAAVAWICWKNSHRIEPFV